jgi:hypothetical protein
MNIKYTLNDLFPTKILTVDLNDFFSSDETNQMTNYIDKIIKEKDKLQINDLTPRYQSIPFLFHDSTPYLFSTKLKNLFLNSCEIYVSTTDNFCKNQKHLIFTHATSWFYCGWPELNKTQSNPWHNHSPAFLSTVFYLKNTGNPSTTGTEFHDPRGPWTHTSQMCYTPGVQGHMVVFPGWLYHKAMNDDSNKEKRYVIASDIYAAVR